MSQLHGQTDQNRVGRGFATLRILSPWGGERLTPGLARWALPAPGGPEAFSQMGVDLSQWAPPLPRVLSHKAPIGDHRHATGRILDLKVKGVAVPSELADRLLDPAADDADLHIWPEDINEADCEPGA